ncbi:hypothetical protein [Alicyclobacillus pomorum]|uniref:hypothetical protein n=1 Tax=Alicyclobacillus pomorum TaxID=204470 RepID=UPI0004236B25|nr:hypothetical protein [Alicyclobacillus pomorum]
MRISHVRVDLSADDINSLIRDFAVDSNLRITDIREDGIHGQVKLLFLNVDFIAKPSSGSEYEASIDIAAHKLVAIPGTVVNRQLREAMKDAPPGIDVIRNSLVVHIPSLLRALGVGIKIRELRCYNGYLRIHVDDVELPLFRKLAGVGK